MKKFKSIGIVALLLFSEFALAETKNIRFDFRDAFQRDIVNFTSDAPLEKIIGLSTAVSGWLEIDPDKLAGPARGEFEVDLRTFDTGSAMRNEQLREKFLGTAEHPVASFSVSRLVNPSKPKLGDQQSVVAKVEGTLKIRGLSRPFSILTKLVYFKQSEMTKQRLNGNLLKLTGTFDIDLSAFSILLPDAFKYRIARFVQVSVDAVCTNAPVPALVPLSK